MQPSRSELYSTRDARTPLTRGFLLGHRHRTQANEQGLRPSFLHSHAPLTSRGTSSNSRRKRSTESVILTDQDGGGKPQQENKRMRTSCCQLPHSHVPIDTTHSELLPSTSREIGDVDAIALRVKVRQFSVTARSATGACTVSTSAFVPACCGKTKAFSAHKSGSNSGFKPLRLHSTNVGPVEDESGESSLTSSVPRRTRSRIKLPAVRPGKAKGPETKHPDRASPSPLPSSPSPAPSPAIFDVDHADLASGTLTCTTTYRDRLESFFDSPTFLFPSFDALDDLTRWGIDAMSFPSTSSDNFGRDPSNIGQSTTTNSHPNSKISTFSNPFSTPFGDDDFLENEIPFPSTRPRVVLEPMGVKKSKTLAADKARNLTASGTGLTSSRNRHLHPLNSYDISLPNGLASVLKGSSTPNSPNGPPPVLPHPLPPLQSAEASSPLNDDSLARTSSYLQRTTGPSQPSLTSGKEKPRVAKGDVNSASSPLNTSNQHSNSQPLSLTHVSSDADSVDSKTTLGGNLRRKLTPLFAPLGRKDWEDDERLGLENCELSVMFPQTAHYEVWDMSDHGWVSVPALLCLMVKDPKRWAATPLATPDVSLIELKCDDVPLPVRFASLCPERKITSAISPSSRSLSPSDSCRPNTYLTTFLGGKSALDDSLFSQNGMSRKRGMSMMNVMNKHEEEQKMGKDKISLEGKWAKTFGLPGVAGCDIRRKESGASCLPARGWYLKFWIPIPTRLFLKRETRTFRIHAQIWMMDQKEEKPDRFETEMEDEWSRDHVAVPSLEAETEMTVSHLRKERDMDGWWWW